MKHLEAAQQLCDFGRKLMKAGLVARTWGNFSIRLDSEHFLITPSGRSYENLKAEEIVILNLKDLMYSGIVKPSSEKELHQRVYLLHSNVKAIIHTHQAAASAVASARIDLPVLDTRHQEIIGPLVPCVEYALPATKALALAVEKKLASKFYPALLLSNHGALSLADSLEKAFDQAVCLDSAANEFVLHRFRLASGQAAGNQDQMIDYYVNTISQG
ncbi:MAG: class II aldolase/adducin family protein [Spirochaetales bacterium]|nr:class II aldolase/adducin family protein [Spirochaetales bacterium]